MSERAELLHGSPWQGVFYVTGGGSPLVSELLTTPGASATVLEARVPYATAALEELLGRTPEQACADDTARALAMAAFQRARHLAAGDRTRPLFGFACTASLATNREKRGRHRAHVAIQTESATCAAELALSGSRAAEEQALLELCWQLLAEALTLPLTSALTGTPNMTITTAQPIWRGLIRGDERAHASAPHDGGLLMPGAFNPLHRGHERMLDIAAARLGRDGAYELSIANVDKPFLDYTEIDARLRQFSKPVWLTRLPTFIEKARHFPGAHFVVGVDTAVRIVEPGYYGGRDARDRALDELAELGTRFVVFGRTIHEQFLCLSDVQLPSLFRQLCLEITRDEFEDPVSSSELREARRAPPNKS